MCTAQEVIDLGSGGRSAQLSTQVKLIQGALSVSQCPYEGYFKKNKKQYSHAIQKMFQRFAFFHMKYTFLSFYCWVKVVSNLIKSTLKVLYFFY